MNNSIRGRWSHISREMLRHPTVCAAVAFAVLTWAYWGYFVFRRGLHGDTIYIELSQTRPGWAGFIYPSDKTRLFITLPFHLAYMLSDGSYLSLHILFGVLVCLTGFLTYRIVKTFVPDAELLALGAGAIALTHGADDFALLVSIIMVRQAVVCVLVAVLLFRLGWLRRKPILILPIALAQYVSLWTYEAGLILLLFVPLLIVSRDVSWRRFIGWSAMWSAVPLFSGASIFYRYKILHETSYQSEELAGNLDVPATIVRLGQFAAQGLAFWRWPKRWLGPQAGCAHVNLRSFALPLVIGTLIFAYCAWCAWRSDSRRRVDVPWAGVLVVGAFFLILAYAPYLALRPDRAVPEWRTQFYAAAPAAVVIVALAGVLDRLVHAQRAVVAMICVASVAAGIYAGLAGQLEQAMRWAPYRQTVAAIVTAAPRIQDDTLVALVGTPPTYFHTLCENTPMPNPPFEDQMWFNSALHVMYPHTRLVGLFWWSDRTSPGSIQFKFGDSGATLEKATIGVDREAFTYDQMIAFAWDREKGAVLLPSFPRNAIPGAISSASYAPMKRIVSGLPPLETLRKLAR